MTVTTELFSYSYHRPEDPIDTADWSPDGNWIACGTRKGAILLFEATTGKEKASYQIGKMGTRALEWFPDSQHLLTWFENTLMICHAWTGERRVLYQHGNEGEEGGGGFGAVLRPPLGLMIASSAYEDEEPTVQVREVETGRRIAMFSPREPFDEDQAQHAEAGLPVYYPPFYPISWSPLGNYIAMGQDYKVHIWEPSTDQRVFLHSVASRIYSLERIETFAWPPDEQYLVFAREEKLTDTAHTEHIIEVWDWAAGERGSTYRGHTNVIRYMQWLSGKDQIVSVSDNEMHLWDAHTGIGITRSVLPVEEHTVFSDAVLSPDRSQVALVGIRYLPGDTQEGLLCVWRHGLDLS